MSAGLQYVQNFEKGFSRRKCGKGFKYLTPDWTALSFAATRARIVSLVIPPAWKDVWICTDADGHIHATGFDDAGRKQYIYHPKWHEASAAHKICGYACSDVALSQLSSMQENLSKTSKKRVIVAAVKTAAAALGNTPAVCRQSYIHSAILSHAEEGLLAALMTQLGDGEVRRAGLTRDENRLVSFLNHLENISSRAARRRKDKSEVAA